MATSPVSARADSPRAEAWYRTVWRWHFYAGLFCVPFILWLSLTGAIYLFKPQIEAWINAPYRHVAAEDARMLPPSSLVKAASDAVPGSVLHRYVLPESPGDAVQILVGKQSDDWRVWVHPVTGAILKSLPEQDRLMRVVFRLHGELLAGEFGSALVELAASWTIVMLLTGLFLWWPRQSGLAGLLWPRTRRGRRIFWRDLHAVSGFWVSSAAILLILSGLPWASNWGDYLRSVRQLTGTQAVEQDWSAGSAADARARAALDRASRAMRDPHAEHRGMTMMHLTDGLNAIDRVAPAAHRLAFAGPVEISPPTVPGGPWTVASQAANRPQRANAEIAADGRLVGVERFARRHWIDRLVGYGVALHEGAWAGLANQVANLLVLIGLVMLALSSMVLWWRRRPQGRLGAPPPMGRLRHSPMLVVLVMMLALLVPLFGISLALVMLAEAIVKRTWPGAARFLGLRSAMPDGV